MDNDHLKQRRNKSNLWFHRASIRNKYAYLAKLQNTCITMLNYLFGIEITSQMSWYLTETQLTHLSFRLRNLLLFTTVSMFSCCSKGGRAIADRDFFLLENQITTPKPFHAKILNYWDFLRRRKPPFYLSLNISSQASNPKVSHMHWNNAIRYFRAMPIKK